MRITAAGREENKRKKKQKKMEDGTRVRWSEEVR